MKVFFNIIFEIQSVITQTFKVKKKRKMEVAPKPPKFERNYPNYEREFKEAFDHNGRCIPGKLLSCHHCGCTGCLECFQKSMIYKKYCCFECIGVQNQIEYAENSEWSFEEEEEK